jgi:hypothetical protein
VSSRLADPRQEKNGTGILQGLGVGARVTVTVTVTVSVTVSVTVTVTVTGSEEGPVGCAAGSLTGMGVPTGPISTSPQGPLQGRTGTLRTSSSSRRAQKNSK